MAATRPRWAAEAARLLVDSTICPRCGTLLTSAGGCTSCRADLGGAAAREVWEASVQAADALARREALLVRLPQWSPAAPPFGAPPVLGAEPVVGHAATQGGVAALASAVAAPSTAPSMAPATAPPSGSPEGRGVSVQSILAIAGAGLFAAAAVVFTFLNPDLRDPVLRAALVAVISLAFGAGAWLLSRTGLRLSAEVVGALGVVLWGLDLGSIATTTVETLAGISWWVPFGAGVAVSAALLVAVGGWWRLRSWLWLGSVGLVVAPALLGYSTGTASLVTVGHLASVLAGVLVVDLLHRIGRRRGLTLTAEAAAVLVVQIAAAASTFVGALVVAGGGEAADLATAAALLLALGAAALLAARHGARGWWGVVSGVTAVLASAAVVIAAVGWSEPPVIAAVPFAGLLMLAVLVLIPWGRSLGAAAIRISGAVTLLVLGIPSVTIASSAAFEPVLTLLTAEAYSGYGGGDASFESAVTAAGLLGALTLAAGAAVFGLDARRLGLRQRAHSWVATAVAIALLPLLGAVGSTVHAAPLAVLLASGCALLLALAAILRTRLPITTGVAVTLAVGAHLLLLSAAASSWRDGPVLAVVAGGGVVVITAVIARTVPAGVRFLHTAAGFAYGLSVVATALDLSALEPIAVPCLTVSVAALVALLATLSARVPVRHWYAVLLVTAVPFLAGVISVITVRSGWTALSTGLMLALALTLLLTTRRGLSAWLRCTAAALIVPSVAVVAVSLGAQLLASSGSPVVLPLIAVVVAVVLGEIRAIDSALRRRIGEPRSRFLDPARAIELSTWVTAALTVLLALVRDAAGLGTTLVVLILIGAGAALARVLSGRRYGWWVAGAAWTAALWTVWAMLGVETAEPYYLPTALVATLVGAILLRRRARGETLVVSGLTTAIVPTLVLLAVWGEGYPQPWRTAGLLTAAVVLLAVAVRRLTRADRTSSATGLFPHDPAPESGICSRTDALTITLILLAGIAALAGSVRAVRWGLQLDGEPGGVGLTAAVFCLSALSTAGLAVAGRLLGRTAQRPAAGRVLRAVVRLRLLFIPALLALAVGPIVAVRDDWTSIWGLWALTLAVLALLLVSTRRSLTRPTALPVPAVIFAVAWAVAVAGWSPRELRVEWFSLPLGATVLLAGAIALRSALRTDGQASLRRRRVHGIWEWPLGPTGSWGLLAPGIILTFLPSVLATGTDPQTWRAILVIGLALVAVLVGSSRRLAAPFLIGLAVLPIENVIVFAVQIGRNIGALPWWITLATAGIVLLGLAVGSERKTNRGGGVGARIRELR